MIIKKIDIIQQKLEAMSALFAGFLIIIMMSLISLETILRKTINVSIPGVFEISAQLMVGVSLLGIAHVQQQKEHISVDLLMERMPKVVVRISNLFVYFLGFFITAIFTWQGILTFMNAYKIGEHTIGILLVPFWPGRLIVVISMLLISIRFLLDLVNEIKSISKSRSS